MTSADRDPGVSIDIWERDAGLPRSPGVLSPRARPLSDSDRGGRRRWHIVYANDALMDLSGYSKVEGVQTSIFEYLHPDDADWIAEAFLLLAEQDPGDAAWHGRPWAPIHARTDRT